ncbi:MAG: polyhydroxyalkanoate synthesis repressor PhaR [Gammaproteobacteria bacterium]|jgi:polyhydroxyalkanoate synthesis repressor PhaR|nr:polyhydroxyalkanoate synthesis repressor PhaR [Gammaproteobacteria bacterium]
MARTIKKYANRRLYDTHASKHVTLEGIRQLVVDGEDIVVIDDTNGEDITRSILLQVIAEQEQGGRPILSAGMLRHIIRFYGNPMQEFMAQYLESSVENFLNQQKTMQDQFRDLLAHTPMATMQTMAAKNLGAWADMQKAFLDAMSAGQQKKP